MKEKALFTEGLDGTFLISKVFSDHSEQLNVLGDTMVTCGGCDEYLNCKPSRELTDGAVVVNRTEVIKDFACPVAESVIFVG